MPGKHVGLGKVWACLLLKNNFYIFLNDWFRLALVKILTPEKISKRGNVNGKKVEEWRKGKEKNKTLMGGGSSSNEQMARD